MQEFKVGDMVEVIRTAGNDKEHGLHVGDVSRIILYEQTRKYYFLEKAPERYMNQEQLRLVKNNSLTAKSIMKNLITSFSNLFTPEPQKSFLKAGITDQSGNITPDGSTVFVTWLLNQNQAAFKAAVVDPINAQNESVK